jgi:hypothetical protein
MNSNLYGREFQFPEPLRQHLRVCMKLCPDANPNVEGYRRNKELQNAKTLTYQQIKRVKNWFDNYQGKKEDAPYVLNGGDKMKNWIETTLGTSRRGLQTTQDRKDDMLVNNAEYLDVVPDIANVNPSKNDKLVQKYDYQVTESLKKINELMKKLY